MSTQPETAPEKANVKQLVPQQPQKKLVAKIADRFGVDADKLLSTLKATAFKVKSGEVTNEQMMALLVVADQYGLNPFTKEIYAFPDKQNGIVPVVSVDGWNRIAQQHEAFDGEEIRYPDTSEFVWIDDDAKQCPPYMEVIVHRKDRKYPTVHREYLDECYRPRGKYADGNAMPPGPWQTHTKRMLEWKTRIQGRRIAFGFAGIYDEDEAQRIVDMGRAEVVETRPLPQQVALPAAKDAAPLLPAYADAEFEKNLTVWYGWIDAGKKSASDIIAMLSTKYTLSEQQKQKLLNPDQTNAASEVA